MTFNSAIFLVFITVFFGFWPWLRRRDNTRWVYITAASFLFYGWWDWRFLFLLIGSGLIDYGTALAMDAFPKRRKWFLVLSLAGNLGSLFIFKYSGFAAQTADKMLAFVGVHAHLYERIPQFALILPIGISFYTFQSLNYTIDVYRGELKATRNIFHFFAYLSLFPHLVAGPILRAKQMIPQMKQLHIPDEEEAWQGLKLIAFGFFRKMVIADNLAPFVNEAFNGQFQANALYWWTAVVFFAFQIYYDFSGYSNIAIGLLKWMGYNVPQNFNRPYAATSLREFWQRWHISLSTWFRDYVYIPLGGSKSSGWRGPNVNMWITMLLSGLWHGASMKFLAWGGLHAAFLNIERETGWPAKLKKLPGGHWLALAATFLQVLVAWVFFRADSFHQGFAILKCMAGIGCTDSYRLGAWQLALLALAVLPEAGYSLRFKAKEWFQPQAYQYAAVTAVVMALVFSVYMRGPGTQFIYFQF
jgi:alginate O-acetyltransferase complex protein AlgI